MHWDTFWTTNKVISSYLTWASFFSTFKMGTVLPGLIWRLNETTWLVLNTNFPSFSISPLPSFSLHNKQERIAPPHSYLKQVKQHFSSFVICFSKKMDHEEPKCPLPVSYQTSFASVMRSKPKQELFGCCCYCVLFYYVGVLLFKG